MVWPLCLPAELRAEGYVQDLRTALPDVLHHAGKQRGSAVLFDQDHTEGTYCAALALHQRFERVVIITPRESIAQDTYMVTKQGIHRRVNMLGIEVATLSEPKWTGAFEQEGRLTYVNVYTGQEKHVDDVAFFSYATPRAPDDALAAPLRAAGLPVHIVGDAKVARGPMAATAEGYAIGRAL